MKISIAAYASNGDYHNRTLDISMSGYILKQLQKYKHDCPKRSQHCPYSPLPNLCGSEAQRPLPPNKSPPLSKDYIKHKQQIIAGILYYARAVDLTVLMALSTIASINRYAKHHDENKTAHGLLGNTSRRGG